MLDVKRVRENFEEVKKAVERRGNGDFGIDDIIKYDKARRSILAEVEAMKNKQSVASKEIPKMKKAGEDATALMSELKELSDKIKVLDKQVAEAEANLIEAQLNVPNTPAEDVPTGTDDSDNVEVRKYLEPTKFEFEPKAHWDIGEDLGILDVKRAAKLAGTRFTVYMGPAARLERSCINFMLNKHVEEHNYIEVLPPFLANRFSMTGTGQLPKFEDDMFHVPAKDFFLIPTAEVPLTNLYANEILKEEDLPLYLTAYTPCFRKEAGSAGRDTRGLVRQHQFQKVEMVKLARPDNSYEELETLVANAEAILKALKLPYRVVVLCSGDLGFSATKTYDIEVWMPSYGRYVEISSCSCFEDYQARRMNLRFRPEDGGKPQFIHTLNGSGLAVGRTVAAILENYQQADGSVVVPEVLRPYMGCDVIK